MSTEMENDLAEITSKWLQQCGPCDYDMPEYGCTHPADDYRPVIMDLVNEVARLRAERDSLLALKTAAKKWRRQRNYEYRPGEINPHLLAAHQEDLGLARAVDALPPDHAI